MFLIHFPHAYAKSVVVASLQCFVDRMDIIREVVGEEEEEEEIARGKKNEVYVLTLDWHKIESEKINNGTRKCTPQLSDCNIGARDRLEFPTELFCRASAAICVCTMYLPRSK